MYWINEIVHRDGDKVEDNAYKQFGELTVLFFDR